MKTAFPQIEAYNKGYLQVSDIHQIYFEEAGNPKGKPIVFLHGGPGGGISPEHRRFFDPQVYRIVLFDQRGAGNSKPLAELKENTTWDLVSDIEKIRTHLNVDSWIVFGGSWGSTLALAYAITHTDKVKALILRGIFLCRPSEIQWFYQEGASHLFPDYWESYQNIIPENERGDFVKAYYKRLTHENADIRLQAAKAWSKWESATSKLLIDQASIDEFDDPDYALSFARIECHYFINNAFFSTNNFLLENANKLKSIPTAIVQGRYDVVCPMRSAWELSLKMPHAKFTVVADAGHSAFEPGICSALIEATESFKHL